MDEATGKFVAVIAFLAIFASALFVVASNRLQAGIPFDPDTNGLDSCGLGAAASVKAYGRFSDPATDLRKRGEIFDRTTIWYSWFSDGQSFPVIGEAKLLRCGFEPATWPTSVDYRFEIDNGRGFVPFYQDRVPQGMIRTEPPQPGAAASGQFLGSFSFQIDGFEFCRSPIGIDGGCSEVEEITDGAVLHVEVVLQGDYIIAGYSNLLIAGDQVRLRSAQIKELRWSQEAYEIGDVARLFYQIPTVSDENGSSGYFLSIFDMNTNVPLPGFDRVRLTKTSGSFDVSITGGLFSNDLETCQNRLRAQIVTDLIVSAVKDTAIQTPTITITAGEPPVVTSVTFDKAEYQEGDTIKISWSSTGNVTKFHVTFSIDGQIIFDEDVEGSQTSLSLRAPISGLGQAQVTAYNRCQPSKIRTEYVTIGNVFPGLCEIFPDAPQCTKRNILGILVAGIVILGAIIGGVITFWLLSKLEKIPAIMTAGIAFAVFAGILLGATAAGYLDVLLPGGGI